MSRQPRPPALPPCSFNSRCSVEGDECRDETDCCLGDPEAGEPTLYCQKASATAATGTCEQARVGRRARGRNAQHAWLLACSAAR